AHLSRHEWSNRAAKAAVGVGGHPAARFDHLSPGRTRSEGPRWCRSSTKSSTTATARFRAPRWRFLSAYWSLSAKRGGFCPRRRTPIEGPSSKLRRVAQPETHVFEDAGGIPNSRLPVLVYHEVEGASEAPGCQELFAANGWLGGWVDGIF